MTLAAIRNVVKQYGVYAGLHDLAFRAARRATDILILKGMVLTEAGIHREFAGGLETPAWRFLQRDELMAFARTSRCDLSEPFVEDALDNGDRCYGTIIGEDLASYMWFSTRPTPITDGLLLHFDYRYSYMYHGFTMPSHRGKRLHGMAMAGGLAEYVRLGQRGLVSYVRANNFASLRSCYRLGCQDFGTLWALRIQGQWMSFETPGCRAYEFRAERDDPVTS